MSVWIIPAVDDDARANYPKTLIAPVEQQRLDRLPEALEVPAGEVYAWGFPDKERNRAWLRQMAPGDICFFYTEGRSGRQYGWAARVLKPLPLEQAKSVSSAFWDSEGFLPYLLERPVEISAPTEVLGKSLDPSGGYLWSHPQGSMPIANRERIAHALESFGTVEAWAIQFIRQHAVSVLPASGDIEHVLEEVVEASTGRIGLAEVFKPKTGRIAEESARWGGGAVRRSKRSKLVGDLGERAVLAHLKATLPAALRYSVRWVAQAGETPGWDIEYVGSDGDLIMVEVKSTTCDAFVSFELTENELRAAQRHGDRYHLFLVANCGNRKAQRLQVIQNPAKAFESLIRPITYRVGG